LSNKIKELKRTNRQLVLRLKNYKGTDLVEMAVQQSREEIMKDLYTVDVDQQLAQELNIEMESLLTQLAHKLQTYIERRAKLKGERMEWSQ
jgi:multidrug efflux pump subunit AcrB